MDQDRLSEELEESEEWMKHPPYHLRTNKAVDRLLLVDLLRELRPNFERCTYYSLGGPFLEDLRVMNHFFPAMRLVSFEKSEHTLRRQEFHRFDRLTELRLLPINDFVNRDYDPESDSNYQPGDIDVFWLDYTGLEYSYFGLFETLLTKVPTGSVVRITLRAEPEINYRSLKDRLPEPILSSVREQVERQFEETYGPVLPSSAAGALATGRNYARMVQSMVQRAAAIALDDSGSDRNFLPVQSARYDDNTQMLSVTGIVVAKGEEGEMRQRLDRVRLKDFDWNEPAEIDIPALSAKERLILEPHLPVDEGEADPGGVLCRILNYNIHDTLPNSRRQLAQYAAYYREYPNFVRASV